MARNSRLLPVVGFYRAVSLDCKPLSRGPFCRRAQVCYTTDETGPATLMFSYKGINTALHAPFPDFQAEWPDVLYAKTDCLAQHSRRYLKAPVHTAQLRASLVLEQHLASTFVKKSCNLACEQLPCIAESAGLALFRMSTKRPTSDGSECIAPRRWHLSSHSRPVPAWRKQRSMRLVPSALCKARLRHSRPLSGSCSDALQQHEGSLGLASPRPCLPLGLRKPKPQKTTRSHTTDKDTCCWVHLLINF